jgi:hypothetical protein
MVEKILFFLLFLSILNIGKHSFNFILELRKEEPEEVRFTKRDLIFLGFSCSYVLTIIFTGIQI